MAAKTRLGLWGHNTRRNGSFAGKTPSAVSPHPVGRITRMGMWGHNTRRAGSFAGKTPGGGGSGGGFIDWLLQARRRGVR